MNVLFINDSTCNPNWGDRAAAITLKRMISASGGNIIATISEDQLRYSSFHDTIDKDNPSVYQYHNTKETLKLFIPPILVKIREKFITYRNPPTITDIIPQRWQDFENHANVIFSNKHLYSNLLKAIEESEVIVIHGDGCMTGIGRIPRAELFLTYIAKKHFNKPVIIVNHTGDFDHPELHKMAQEIYPLFDDVVFRDEMSVERYQALCDGRFAPDSAFLFKPITLPDWLPVAQRPTYFDVWPDTARFDPAEPYICIGGSSIYGSIKNTTDLINGISQLIDHIGSIYSGQIVLTASDVCDQNIFREIANKFVLPLIGLTTQVQQTVDVIGNAEAYIGGRWHPSIFALRGGTPIIPITSKTFKMQALARMSGLPDVTFDAFNLDKEKDAIGRQLKGFVNKGEELRNKLRSWAEKESENSWDNVTYLKNMSSNQL